MRLLPALLLLAVLHVHADDSQSSSGSFQTMDLGTPLPAPLQQIEKEGGTVVRSFPAPDGLTGWVLHIQGRYLVVYSTKSGDYLLSGVLIDKDGKNLSAAYTDQYAPKPDPNKVAAALSTDTWLVDEGSLAAPPLYIYADPNCIYCNKLWVELQPYVKSGKLRARWALLDFLKRTSKGRAAAILSAHDRAAALAEDELKFDKAQEEGGIPELQPVPPDIDNVLAMHTLQMNEAGAGGTPTLVFRNKDGWTIAYGVPQDMPGFVASLVK